MRLVYRADMDGGDAPPVRLTVRARNRTADGLGLPLPAGKLALYQRGAGRNLLVGEGSVGDKAVGEQVEIDIATATGITARRTPGLLTVTNANATPIMFEARLGDEAPVAPSARLVRRDGQWLWVTTIAANGSTMLRYATRR